MQGPAVKLQLPNDQAMVSQPSFSYSSYPLLRVYQESFISPRAYYDFDLSTMTYAVRSVLPMASAGYDYTQYSSRRVYVQSTSTRCPSRCPSCTSKWWPACLHARSRAGT